MKLQRTSTTALTQPTATSLIQQAESRMDALLAWQQANHLPAVLTPEKKYQVYATTLIEAVSQIPQSEENLVYNMSPLAPDYAALVTRMHRHLTQDLTLRAPTLAIFARQQGEETASRLLFVLIKQFTESVSIRHKLNLKQTYEMASLVQVEFSDLSLSDVVLCLRQTKSGQYGPLYESFDFVRLGEFLRKYRAEKAAYQARKHTDLKHTPSTALQDLMTGLEHAPEHIRQSIQGMAENIATPVGEAARQAMEASRRPPIGVDVDRVLSDVQKQKPKPTYQRPRPLTEQEFADQIRAHLTVHLDSMSQADYDYYIDHYRTFKQEKLARWLENERQQRHNNGWSSAA